VATPGKLLDFHRHQDIGLRKIEVLIIDDADRILDSERSSTAHQQRRNHMPSIKQLQNRLLNKKLNKVNLNIANAEKSKNNAVLRKLNQEKGTLDRDIRKLERQLITEKKA